MNLVEKIIRRIAKTLSIFVLLIFAFLFIAGGFANLSGSLLNFILILFFPIGVVMGMLIAWEREVYGSIFAIFSLILFYFCNLLLYGTFPAVPLAFTSPAFLFLILQIFKTKS